MIRAAVATCLAVACALLPASARSVEAPRTAYAEGRFIDAAELAAVLGTSEGYALAARSLSIHGYYVARDDEKQALFDRAARLAQEAIRLDPVNPEAHLELAHAMGRRAQTLGVLQAAGEGYAEKVRDAIKDALRLDPDMATAHLSLATWHAEAASNGGFVARALYGATEKDALAHYERALELAPDEKVVPVEYALGLLLLDDDENREQARGLLARAIEMPSKDALDRLVHRQAVERLASLDRAPSGSRGAPTGRAPNRAFGPDR